MRRIGEGALLFVVVSFVIFFCTSILPGDAASSMLGRQATPESLTVLRHQLGLDEPIPQRYFDWLIGLVSGDLGESLAARQPVTEIISTRVINTLILALSTMAIMVPLAIGLGIAAGLRASGKLDHTISGISLAGISLPEFVVGNLLIYFFAVTLNLLPPVSIVPIGQSPIQHPTVLVLPVATLLVVGLAYTVRMVRAGVIEVMASEYVQMARLNGIRERRVVLKHALRNGLAPTVQVVALTFQWLVGGVFIVETVFAYRGIGEGLVQAVLQRDIPYVQAVAMLIAVFTIGINIIADLIVVLLIPKLRAAPQ